MTTKQNQEEISSTNFTTNFPLDEVNSPTRSERSDQERSTDENSPGSILQLPSPEDSFTSIELDSPKQDGKDVDWRATRRASESAITEEENKVKERNELAVDGSPGRRRRSSTLASIPGSPSFGLNYTMESERPNQMIAELSIASPSKFTNKPKLHAIIPRKPSPTQSLQSNSRRKSSQSHSSRSKPLSPIPDEINLNPTAGTFTPVQGPEIDFRGASVEFIVKSGKNAIGDLTREAKAALGRKGLRVVPSLIGPGSLPYARCPSGIDAVLFPSEKDADPWTQHIHSNPNSPGRQRAVSVPLPGNARYSQPHQVRTGRIPTLDGSINGNKPVEPIVQRAKNWLEDDLDASIRAARYDYSRPRSGTIESVNRNNDLNGMDLLYQVGFGMGVEDYRAQQFDTRIPPPPPAGFQNPYLPYIPLSIPPPPAFYPVPPQIFLQPFSSPNAMQYPSPPHLQNRNGSYAPTPFFDPAIVAVGHPLGFQGEYDDASETDSEKEEEEAMLKNSGFYPFSPPLVRKKSRRSGFLIGSPTNSNGTRKNGKSVGFENEFLPAQSGSPNRDRRASATGNMGARSEEGRRLSIAEIGIRRRSAAEVSLNPLSTSTSTSNQSVKLQGGALTVTTPSKTNIKNNKNVGRSEKVGSIAIGGSSTITSTPTCAKSEMRKTPGAKQKN